MGESSLLLTAMSGASSAYSAYEGGQANSAVDKFNAHNSRLQAEQAIEAGASAQARVSTRESLLRGEQTAGFAGQGVLANAGTARAVMAGSAAVSEMDKLMIGVNARRQAYGFQVAAANSDFQAHLARVRGNEQALAALTGTGTKMNSLYNDQHPSAERPYSAEGKDLKSLLADEGISGGEMTETHSRDLRFH